MQNIQSAWRQLSLTENFQQLGVEFCTSFNGQTWARVTGAYLAAKPLVFISADTSTCWY